MTSTYYKLTTAKAPVNIAVIKYWGKSDEKLKIPINDSLSGTLSTDEMCAKTTVAISSNYHEDEFWLNGEKQELSNPVKFLLEEVRKLSKVGNEITNYKVHIASRNNFPTAAGLASSAAGYACLAFVLGHSYGLVDTTQLSKLARLGSGSACRSLFGGFVQWVKGEDHESSMAKQIVDQDHWPEMKVLILVTNDHAKDVPSSEGMRRSVQTSSLLKFRADQVVPTRISAIIDAILTRDFHKFAQLTMQDSNQFHATCLDSEPPIFYLNETSRQIIKLCTIINSHHGKNVVAYTFDAGPNACIYILDDYVPSFLQVLNKFFSSRKSGDSTTNLITKGIQDQREARSDEELMLKLTFHGIKEMPDAVRYLIHTKLGAGPVLDESHLSDEILKP